MENIIKIDCETREIISKSKIFLGISLHFLNLVQKVFYNMQKL